MISITKNNNKPIYIIYINKNERRIIVIYPKLINSFSNIKRSNANTRVYIIEVLNKQKKNIFNKIITQQYQHNVVNTMG